MCSSSDNNDFNPSSASIVKGLKSFLRPGLNIRRKHCYISNAMTIHSRKQHFTPKDHRPNTSLLDNIKKTVSFNFDEFNLGRDEVRLGETTHVNKNEFSSREGTHRATKALDTVCLLGYKGVARHPQGLKRQ